MIKIKGLLENIKYNSKTSKWWWLVWIKTCCVTLWTLVFSWWPILISSSSNFGFNKTPTISIGISTLLVVTFMEIMKEIWLLTCLWVFYLYLIKIHNKVLWKSYKYNFNRMVHWKMISCNDFFQLSNVIIGWHPKKDDTLNGNNTSRIVKEFVMVMLLFNNLREQAFYI